MISVPGRTSWLRSRPTSPTTRSSTTAVRLLVHTFFATAVGSITFPAADLPVFSLLRPLWGLGSGIARPYHHARAWRGGGVIPPTIPPHPGTWGTERGVDPEN